MSNTNLQSDGKFLSKLYFRVLPAQIFMMFLTGVNNLIDGLVSSNCIGAGAMGVIGLYAPFSMIWLAVSAVMMVGSQVLCARYMGSGDLQKTRGVFSLNLVLTFAIMLIATLLSFVLSTKIAVILGASEATVNDLSAYIMGRGVGLLPMVLGAQFSTFLSLEGQDKYNYFSTATLLGTNTVMDLIFAAVLKRGIGGVGLATSISQWTYMATTAVFFLSKKASLKFSFKSINWKELWSLVKIGFPNALVFFLTSIRSSTFNNLLASYDPTMVAVAAISTYVIVMMIFESVGKGVASAGRILSSVSYGEEDGKSITTIMKTVFTKGLLVSFAASVLVFLLAGYIPRMFYPNPDSEVYRLTARSLRFGALVLVFETIAYIFSNYFQSIGRNIIVNVMSVLEGVAVMVPIGFLLIPKMGLDGVMLSLVIGYAVLALVGPVYAIIYWKRRPRTLSEWVTIPADFGAPDDECLDVTIHNLEEAVNTSREIQKFCEEHNVDQKKATYSALAVEELCLGIIKDRFEADKKKHRIEVHVVHKEDRIFISLKDDCKPFNAKERSELVNPQDDSPKSLSIRVFMGIVKETEYQLTLGINVFTVTF